MRLLLYRLGRAFLLLAAIGQACGSAAATNGSSAETFASVELLLRKFEDSKLTAEAIVEGGDLPVEFAGASWRAKLTTTQSPGQRESRVLQTQFTVVRGTSSEVSAGLRLTISDWSSDCYLLFPGAVYAGNRFTSIPSSYPPLAPPEFMGLQCPPFIADIPRLNTAEGSSRLQLQSSDMSWPVCGLFNPATKRALLVLPPSHTRAGLVGFDFAEESGARKAVLTVSAPGVREQRYAFINRGVITTANESPDRGVVVAVGEALDFSVKLIEFECDSIQGLFAQLFTLSRAAANQAEKPAVLPFSAMHDLIETHYNRDFWWNGLYRTNVGARNPYQTGWCGGLMAEFALLANSESPLTRSRSLQHFDKALTEGIASGGLFYGQFNGTEWVADHLRYEAMAPSQVNFTLTRRQGDALLYTLKTFALLEDRNEKVPEAWSVAARRNALALCAIWRRYQQFGQFLHQTDNSVLLGNSTSGAIIPGALVLAFKRYGDPEMLAVAQESAQSYYEQFVRRGLTTGGPGDAGQAPDSESCEALVESYAILFDATADPKWLEYAGQAARQFSTWVMPYNFSFPEGTIFHALGMKSYGTVLANAQNKHSSPGIATHSGVGLFKLFRATGDKSYLELIRDIARTLPQYVSREDRPIKALTNQFLPSGWINERVNINDWDQNIGGVFYGPCWSEVSAMLTRAELPGVYAQPDTGLLCALDNVNASWRPDGSLRIENPTRFSARVRLLLETVEEAGHPLSVTWFLRARDIDIPAGGSVDIPVVHSTAKDSKTHLLQK